MTNKAFHFNTVGDIKCGAGVCENLVQELKNLGVERPLVVTDQGLVQCGLIANIEKTLTAGSVSFSAYSDVIPDPTDTVVLAALDLAKTNQCDGVIGFGGGSSMDVAKLIAVLLKENQGLDDIYGVDQVTGPRFPLIQIPTTAGTGSEVTSVAIITTGGNTKKGVVSSVLMSDLVLLDPVFTLGLPPHVTAATGIDAMVHAIEAYTSKIRKNPISDMLAKEALRLLSANISCAVKEGSNLDARENMLLGAMFAGQAFANAPVAAVHALAYPLGGNYHIPHGLSNSLVLPHVLRFNAEAAASEYREIAEIIFAKKCDDLSDADVIEKLASYFLELAQDLGLQTELKQMNIPESDLTKLANEAMDQQRLLVNNPRDVSEADALKIYQQAY